MAEEKAKTLSITDKIGGTLTLEKAEEIFGKSKAIQAMKTFAMAGGHGMFEESELKSPIFGGLAMPDEAETQAKINTALNTVK